MHCPEKTWARSRRSRRWRQAAEPRAAKLRPRATQAALHAAMKVRSLRLRELFSSHWKLPDASAGFRRELKENIESRATSATGATFTTSALSDCDLRRVVMRTRVCVQAGRLPIRCRNG
jgi:hypothetical protein